MENNKKKIIFIILFILIICVLFINNNNDEDIRFRIIANSNSSYDQTVKLELRDEIYNFIGIDNINISIIEKECAYILEDLNVSYKASVSLEKQYFESKYFNNELIPGGNYTTLVIRLGNAEGKNYFTILCPEYFNIGYDEVSSGEVEYKIWIWEEIKNLICN